jgi:hypothetical protein
VGEQRCIRSFMMRAAGCTTLILLVTCVGTLHADSPDRAGAEFFEKQVRPLLVEQCFQCHSDAKKKPKGNLRLDSRAGVLKGGDSGPAAVAGKPDESLLVKAIHYKMDGLKMPKNGKLKDADIAVLTRWVEMGLPWPAAGDEKPIATTKKFEISEEQRKFWSFQPVKVAAPREVTDRAWAKSEIDRYLLAAMVAQRVKPAAPADKRTLLRRVTFDLIGLPPTPAYNVSM